MNSRHRMSGSASFMASCFGDDALHEAAWRADEHLRRGDTCRSELWRQIAHSLREMRQR